MNPASWSNPPRYILDQIFENLNYKDLSKCEQVCRMWKLLIDESYLWKDRFRKDFNLIKENLTAEEKWKQEYRRIIDCAPCVLTTTISEHKDEVLHVSFSKDGSMFCTCSKDATAKLFESSHPFSLLHTDYFGRGTKYEWHYTQFSQFNQTTTQLLVSGKCTGFIYKGEIVVYAISEKKEFSIQSRVPLSPYDAMGAWFDINRIVTTKVHIDSDEGLQQISIVPSDHCISSLMHPTFLFSLKNTHFATYILIADLTKFFDSVDPIYASTNIHKIHLTTCNNMNSNKIVGKSCLGKNDTSQSIHKILLSFVGEVNDTYHQVGMKIVRLADLSLSEQKFHSTRLNERQSLSKCERTSWDYILELQGQGVGMSLSQCSRYLFVNIRKWVTTSRKFGKSGCPISTDVTMLMFDLVTMRPIREFKGHKGYSDVEIFFLGISSCDVNVASGSEDQKGYIWNTKYGIQVSVLNHTNVVNGVCLNPCDPSMAISVSDDHTIKVWHSKSYHRNHVASN